MTLIFFRVRLDFVLSLHLAEKLQESVENHKIDDSNLIKYLLDEIWLINFASFNTFLVIFQPKQFTLYFIVRVHYPRGKSNCV